MSDMKKFTPEWLSAADEIRQLKARYCYAADMKDWPAFASVFCDDGQWDIREFPIGRDPVTGERRRSGRFDFDQLEQLANAVVWPVIGRETIEATARAIAGPVVTIHQVFTPVIEFESPTIAKAIWPMQDILHFPEGSPIRWMRGMGHYHERYERTGDRWQTKVVKLKRLWVDAE